MDGECEGGREWTRVLTPADLQPTVVQSQTLEGGNLVEGHGSSRVNEGNKLTKSSSERTQAVKDQERTYCDVLILHVPDAL